MPNLIIFFWINASFAAVNSNGIKTYLANGLSTIFIKGKRGFINDPPKILSRNPPDCPILNSWVFDNFILTDELSAEVLQKLKSCVLVNYDLCRKLASSPDSPITFDKRFKLISVPFFIPDFNLLNWELENFIFKLLYWVILYWCYI